MANIDKQLIARLPLGKNSEFTLDYTKDWGVPIKKIWNKKEVERVIFCLSNEEGVLECSKNIADMIVLATENVFNKNKIYKEKINNVKIDIFRDEENNFEVSVFTGEMPRKSVFRRTWNSVTKIFRQ